jgi:hypothetical protein
MKKNAEPPPARVVEDVTGKTEFYTDFPKDSVGIPPQTTKVTHETKPWELQTGLTPLQTLALIEGFIKGTAKAYQDPKSNKADLRELKIKLESLKQLILGKMNEMKNIPEDQRAEHYDKMMYRAMDPSEFEKLPEKFDETFTDSEGREYPAEYVYERGGQTYANVSGVGPVKVYPQKGMRSSDDFGQRSSIDRLRERGDSRGRLGGSEGRSFETGSGSSFNTNDIVTKESIDLRRPEWAFLMEFQPRVNILYYEDLRKAAIDANPGSLASILFGHLEPSARSSSIQKIQFGHRLLAQFLDSLKTHLSDVAMSWFNELEGSGKFDDTRLRTTYDRVSKAVNAWVSIAGALEKKVYKVLNK